MAKLETIFFELLKTKDYQKDDLISETKKISGVDESRIESRIQKLIRLNKLFPYNKNMISLNSLSEKKNVIFDEIYNYENITLGRKGREIHISSSFKDTMNKETIDKVKQNLSEYKKEANKLLTDIEKLIIKCFNPLDVLGHVSLTNLTCDPEEYTESSFKGKQFFVELLHNIILKHDLNEFPKESDFTKLNELTGLLDNYENAFHHLITYEIKSRDDFSFEEQNVYFRTIINFLFMRGDAYPQHTQQIAEEFFSYINPSLLKKDFTIKDYFTTVNEIRNQIDSNLSSIFELFSQIKREHEAWLETVEQNTKKGKSTKEINTEYQQRIGAIREKMLPNYKKFAEIGTYKDIFEIKLNEKINKKILDSLVTNFNDNQNWSSPFDLSSVPLRPILKIEEKYYCFIIQHLIRNVIPIIEGTFVQKDNPIYGTEKGDYFEHKALELLTTIFSNEKMNSKLKYPTNNELDGLIIYKSNLFLVEIKGKKRRCIACTDDVLKMTKEDAKKQIDEPFKQSKRALEYIISKPEVEFRNKVTDTSLSIRQEDFKNIILINVTADSFSEFTTDLNILKSWDPELLKGDVYPWNVNIYDLLVVTDLLENEDDFTDYVSERVRLSKDNDIKSIDELEYLGYYLQNGSLTKEKDIKGKTIPMIIGYSEEIDKWYSFLRGEVEFAEKPRKRHMVV